MVCTTQAQIVIIPNDDLPIDGISIKKQLSVVEDKSHLYGLRQILDMPDSSFSALDSFTTESNRSTYWLKGSIENQRLSKFETILKFNHLSHVTTYLIKGDSIIEQAYGGEYSKADQRRLRDGRLYQQLDIPQGSTILLIKIKQRKNFAPILDFTLVETEQFFASLQKRTFFESLVFGSFGILFIYGLILYFGNKHRPYLWLSLTVILKAVFFSQMIGYFTDFFMPNNPKFAWDMLVLLMYGSGMTSLLLVRDFLYLRRSHVKFNLILNAFLIFLAIQAGVIYYIKYVYEDYLLGNMIGFASYIPQGILLIYIFIKLMPKIPHYKRPVIIGIIGFAALTLVTSINFLANLEKSYGQYTWNEVIGTLIFLVLYFFTLGQEMQLNEKEKNLALEKVNQITSNQKQELEHTVKKRTKELEISKHAIEVQNNQLREHNDQIELLLKEIHHRVKNNLQVISSLLDLQARDIGDEKVLSTFMEGQSRVKAMALIHQKLYQNKDLESIDFTGYSEQLTKELAKLYPSAKHVKTIIYAKHNAQFDIDTAVPLGLILNELISNAYKYAFHEGEQGELNVSVKSLGEGRHQMTVADTGKGLPKNVDFNKTTSLGLRLVKRLSKQLYGSVSYDWNQGAKFVITFMDTLQRKTL